MSVLQEYDFLKINEDKQLRKRVANILSSYSYFADVLSEVLQNAVDAVDEHFYKEYDNAVSKIHIEFDISQRKIIVIDTGIGMTWDMLKNAPSPDTTFKDDLHFGNRRSRGEKGEGLAFLTFTCNYLNIRTCNGSQTIEATIVDANNWLHGKQNANKPRIVPSNAVPQGISEELGSTKYTRIEMGLINTMDYSQRDIFDLSDSELIYLLRTRTAIGNVSKTISNQDPSPIIKVTLRYINSDNEPKDYEIPYSFLSPEEYLTLGSKIQFEEFLRLKSEAKLHIAQGKALIYRKDHVSQGGRVLRCYAFAMAVKAFEDITQDKRGVGEYAPDDWSGIYIATRGMPTGIKVEPRTSSGYWRRVFVLIEDDDMKFDVGRKTLQGQAKPMMQSIADMIWSDIQDYLYALTPSPIDSITRTNIASRQQLFYEALNEWTSINFNDISYEKEPQREQMVFALFYELIGANLLRGYKTLRNNSRDQYDAFIRYQINKSEIGKLQASNIRTKVINDQIIVEFKQNAIQILKDINENKKDYTEIDLLVCWDITKTELQNLGIDVEEIPAEQIYFHGSTHKLYFPGFYPMKQTLIVMELKTVINRLKESLLKSDL